MVICRVDFFLIIVGFGLSVVRSLLKCNKFYPLGAGPSLVVAPFAFRQPKFGSMYYSFAVHICILVQGAVKEPNDF
jgi:hypothetical protein